MQLLKLECGVEPGISAQIQAVTGAAELPIRLALGKADFRDPTNWTGHHLSENGSLAYAEKR